MNKKILAAIIEDDYLKWQKIFLARPDAVILVDELDESKVEALPAIRRGFMRDLSIDQIKSYIDRDPEVQTIIIDGYKEGLNLEDIEFAINLDLDYFKLVKVWSALKNGVDKKLIKKYTSRIYGLDEYQLEQVFLGLIDGMSEELVDLYAKCHILSGVLVEKLREWLHTSNEAKEYVKQGFDGFSLYQILLAIEAKMTKEQIAYIANPKLCCSQIKVIREALMDGINYEDIPDAVLDSSLPPDKLFSVITAMKNGATNEQLEILADNKFTWEQASALAYGFTSLKLSTDQVLVAANPEFDVHEMENILNGFSNGLTYEQVKMFAIHNPPFNPILVCKALEANLSEEQISFLMNVKKWDSIVLESLLKGLSFEKINVYLDGDFYEAQVEQIKSGLESGLAIEQVLTYAKSKYSSDKMKQMKEKLLGQKLIEDFKLTCD